jgi:hypothetical protein
MEARVEAGKGVRVKPQTARIHTDTALQGMGPSFQPPTTRVHLVKTEITGPFGFANLMKTCRLDFLYFLRKCTKICKKIYHL